MPTPPNFPVPVGQFGLPLMGLSDILPFQGNTFFVDETNGNDGNDGGPYTPLATLSQAHSLCTAEHNDVVLFTGTIHQSSTLTWSKNKTHLIGLCAEMRRGKRSRISVTGSTAFTPLVNVTAQGCIIRNVGTFYGFNSASNNAICWTDSGGRNYYDRVEFLGFGDGTASTGTANKTGSRAMLITGSTGENTFERCVWGMDTVTRNAANFTLEFAAGTPRNHFIDCDFEALLGASGTGSSHIYGAAAACIDRYQTFTNCRFHNCVKSTGSAMAQLVNLAASAGGYILLDRCTTVGATAIETAPTNQVFIDGGAPTAATTALAVNNA